MKFVKALATSAVLLPLTAHSWNYLQQGADWTGMCATGRQQSPVAMNITDLTNPPFEFTYHQDGQLQTLQILNDGTTLRVSITDRGHRVVYANTEYWMTEYHFHSPGEHIINGTRPDLEMHIEHQTGEGASAKKVILAVPWYNSTTASADEFLTDVMRETFEVNQTTTRSCATGEMPCLDPRVVLNAISNPNWVQYEGSETTPPCTQNVIWFIDGSVRHISLNQLNWFRAKLVYTGTNGNYREIEDKHDSLTLTPANGTMVEYPDAAFSARGVSLMSFAVAGVVAIYTAGMHV